MRALIATAVFVMGLAVVAAQDEKNDPPAQKGPAQKEPDKPPGKKDDKPKDPTAPPIADPVKLIPPIIEGGYTVVGVERDGQPVPLDGYKDAIVRVVNGRFVGTDRDRREFLVATYVLNTEKKPWALDLIMLTTTKDPVKGLVKKDGYVLTLIHSLPGGDAPTEFKTKKGQQMFVLRGFVLDPLPPPNKFSNSP